MPEAVILAAGNGLRMAARPHLPKPLIEVGGRPLLGHVLDCLATAGVTRAHIVVGYGARAISGCRGLAPAGLDARFLYNPRFDEPNGLSLLRAQDALAGPFLLLMGDHLLDPRTITRLLEDRARGPRSAVAVDRRLDLVFDADDATLVETRGGRVRRIGKRLPGANAVDTGLFFLTPDVFDAMRASVERGDSSLTGGIAALAADGAIDAWEIGAARWIDVDTPEAAAHAGRLLQHGHVGAAAGACAA